MTRTSGTACVSSCPGRATASSTTSPRTCSIRRPGAGHFRPLRQRERQSRACLCKCRPPRPAPHRQHESRPHQHRDHDGKDARRMPHRAERRTLLHHAAVSHRPLSHAAGVTAPPEGEPLACRQGSYCTNKAQFIVTYSAPL